MIILINYRLCGKNAKSCPIIGGRIKRRLDGVPFTPFPVQCQDCHYKYQQFSSLFFTSHLISLARKSVFYETISWAK